MELTPEMIMAVVSAIITYLFGLLAKKFNWMESKYIPLQNLVVGLLSALICYALKLNDSNILVTTLSCLFGSMASGGTYDLKKAKEE